MDEQNVALAYVVLRLGTGVNLFMHGATRLGGSFAAFHDYMLGLFANSILPGFLLEAMTYFIPAAEVIFGLLLILGLKTKSAVIGSSTLMIILIFGMALLQKWDVVGLQMNYLVIYFLLLLFLKANRFSFDHQTKK